VHPGCTFEVDEANEHWTEIAAWIEKRRASDIANTKFSKNEIAKAGWLELQPSWHHGFPQPNEDSWGRQLGAAFNTAGRITKMTSQMGTERQYGKLGETVYEKKTVSPETRSRLLPPPRFGPARRRAD